MYRGRKTQMCCLSLTLCTQYLSIPPPTLKLQPRERPGQSHVPTWNRKKVTAKFNQYVTSALATCEQDALPHDCKRRHGHIPSIPSHHLRPKSRTIARKGTQLAKKRRPNKRPSQKGNRKQVSARGGGCDAEVMGVRVGDSRGKYWSGQRTEEELRRRAGVGARSQGVKGEVESRCLFLVVQASSRCA